MNTLGFYRSSGSILGATALCAVVFGAPQAIGNQAALERGEILVDSQSTDNGVVANMQAVIDAPIEKVWALVTNCNGFKKTMPNIESARIVKKTAKGMRCEVVADLPFPLSDLRSVTDAVHTETADMKKRTWTLVEGDYEVNEGSWTLKRFGADGQKTLAIYNAKLEPKMSVPNSILKLAQKRTLPKVAKNLRKFSK